MKKVVLFALLLILFSLPVAAQDTLTVLCTPQEDWCVAMTEAFEAETGIQTNYVRMSSGESLARVRATAADPEFSVWWGGPADAFIAANEEGLLESYDSPNAAMIADDQKGDNWIGVYVGALGFCSNVEILNELGVDIPASWTDLLNPALQGNVAMAHPATSGTAFTTFWTNVELAAASPYMNGSDESGVPNSDAIDGAFNYFTQLHPNILQYTRSGSAPGRMAGSGEIAVAIIFSHDCVKLQVEGFEGILATSFAEEGMGFEIGGMAILKNAPELEAAQVWYDWALTADAQAIGATVNSLQLPTNPDTPVPDLAVKLDEVNLVDYHFIAAGQNRQAVVERYDAEIAPIPTE